MNQNSSQTNKTIYAFEPSKLL